jgi:hypothetical protein
VTKESGADSISPPNATGNIGGSGRRAQRRSADRTERLRSPVPRVCDSNNPSWGSYRGGDGGFAERVDGTGSRGEHDVSDPAPNKPPAPTIRATTEYLITGAGFLPDHAVTVRVTYTSEDISDCLIYKTNPSGDLYAELPTSPTHSTLHITATDHRADPDGVGGFLWSNTHTVRHGEADA